MPAPSDVSTTLRVIFPSSHLLVLQVQKKIVGKLYSTLESSLDDEDDQQQKKKASFRQLLRIAEKASVWQAWPFASMQDDEDNLVTVHHNLSDLLFRAYHAGKVPQVLGLLHMLFKVLPPCSTTTSPHLLDVMDLLAEIKQSPGTPSSCSKKIGQMLLPWVQTLQQVVSDKSLGTAQPADSSAAVSSDMQQQSSPATAFSSSAVQQTPGIAPASHESLSAIEQVGHLFPSPSSSLCLVHVCVCDCLCMCLWPLECMISITDIAQIL